MLEINSLQTRIGEREILRGLNLTVKAGEVHAIMGPNGAGKSSLAYTLAGRPGYEVTSGSVRFDGADLLALAPEERWWLYTMTVATTGQAMRKGIGWRKALRAAIADNPFVKGEGMSPKARRELLGHSQLTLEI